MGEHGKTRGTWEDWGIMGSLAELWNNIGVTWKVKGNIEWNVWGNIGSMGKHRKSRQTCKVRGNKESQGEVRKSRMA